MQSCCMIAILTCVDRADAHSTERRIERPSHRSLGSSSRTPATAKPVNDMCALFGEAGEAAVLAFAQVNTQARTDSLAATAARLESDAAALLAAWAPTDSEPPTSKKPASRSSSERGLSAHQRERLCALVQSAATWRLVQMINAAPEAERAAIAKEFSAHPKFARTLALIVAPHEEDLSKVLRVARLLMAQRSGLVESLPELAAAVAVVHDAPLFVQVNENLAAGCGPVDTFDHFVAHEGKMRFGVRGIAPELLLHLVDVAGSAADLSWAFAQFAGHPSVGVLYDKVEYDFDHLEEGKPKRVTVEGWSLKNIMRYGGVCADQAYFATTVAKAIGVPATYTIATDGVLSHAWIGFVGQSNRDLSWDEVGRYGGYQSVEGFIRDPQTGAQLSSTVMPMLVRYGSEPQEARLASAALRIAAGHMLDTVTSVGTTAALTTDAAPQNEQRMESLLSLIHVAVQCCLTDARSWEVIGRAAASGAMTQEQKRQWSSDILNLCSDSYPEFAWRTIAPMIRSITDIPKRQAALDGALAIFQHRGDLAGQILLEQASLYKSQGNPMGAGRCYEMILSRYYDDGPFAIVALHAASEILAANRDAVGNVTLHERAFRAMEVPISISPQFARQSNWCRTGAMLAAAYRILGRERDAGFVEQRMIDVTK